MFMGRFVCKHMGSCCENPAAPVNVTAADLVRIADYLQASVLELFGTGWCMIPFGIPEKRFSYTVEPGLETPCQFHKEGRCRVYPVRPLNCRMFPYWILAVIPKEGREHFVKEDLCCAANHFPSVKERKKIRAYVNAMGKVLMEESRVTDEVLKNLNLSRTLDVKSESTEFFNDFLAVTYSGKNLRRMQAEHQIAFAKTLIKQEEYIPFVKYVVEHHQEIREKSATADSLIAIEKMLD